VLAVIGSQSKAIRLLELLRINGIKARIVSTPSEFTDKGCSYSIIFSEQDTVKLKNIMIKSGISGKIV